MPEFPIVSVQVRFWFKQGWQKTLTIDSNGSVEVTPAELGSDLLQQITEGKGNGHLTAPANCSQYYINLSEIAFIEVLS